MTAMGRVGWILAIIGLSACGAWSVREAEACSCIVSKQPCEAAWSSGPIFRGRVVSIDSTSVPAPRVEGHQLRPWPMRRVTFAVAEQFRGDLTRPQISVLTGTGGGDCGYDFREGEEYIVYTHEPRQDESREGRPLETSICTRTRPSREADEDLAYLRSLTSPSNAPTGRIFGSVRLDDLPVESSRPEFPPQPGVSVRLTKAGAPRGTRTTGANGEFDFTGLEAGTYHLDFAAADIYRVSIMGQTGDARDVELRSPHACVNVSASVHHDGHVLGRIVDASGAGVADVTVELGSARRADDPRNFLRVTAHTNADGSFEITGVPAGRFVLGLDTQFDYRARGFSKARLLFPGVDDAAKARVVEVGPGERVRIPDFVLPRGYDVNAAKPSRVR